MQRIKWVDQKLKAWAEWRVAASGGYCSPAYHDISGSDRGDPVSTFVEFSIEQEAEAMRIDAALASLPRPLSDTVVASYTWEGGLSVVTSKLRITRATVHRRLCHADIRIAAWFDAQQAMSKNAVRRRLV